MWKSKRRETAFLKCIVTFDFEAAPHYTRQYKDFNDMKNSLHHQILDLIKNNSGKGTAHTFLDAYLGNSHFRYPISAPVLRRIAKEWMKEHRDLTAKEFAVLLTDLVEAESATEKTMAGVLLDYATPDQRKFNPSLFDKWLNHLEGWAEIDALCTGKYAATELAGQWSKWQPLLIKFSKSKNINKRRASIVFFCSPFSKLENKSMAQEALKIVDSLKAEKKILITKAISWVLRSMVRYNREALETYLKIHANSLPKIALRETKIKLETGKKTKKKG
jgi:3-methyladenine DNA glycosylase AlkD